MNKICTSLEQSKKLLEFGFDINTADMWWAERYEGRVTENGQYIIAEEPYYYSSLIKPSDNNYSQDTIKDIPAWSLSALLEILPNLIDCSFKTLNFLYGWHCAYMNGNGEILNNDTTADNPIDACYEMIVKLKEQNLI